MSSNRVKTALKLIVATAALVLAACSAEVTGPSGMPDGGGNTKSDFENKVEGPSLEGIWKSACVEDRWSSSGYITFDITITGQEIVRLEKKFSDSRCVTKTAEITRKGPFRFTADYGGGIFQVTYHYELNGGYSIVPENVRRQGNTLFISDRYTGESVQPLIALTLVGAPAPKPGDTPAPAPTATPAPAPPIETVHSPHFGQWITYTGVDNGVEQIEEYGNNGSDGRPGSTWTVSFTVKRSGQTVDMGYKYYKTLWSSTMYQDALANCVAGGGALETIITKVGTFRTCRKLIGGYIVWKGNVPFVGNVRVESLDGTYKTEVTDVGY